MAGPMQPGVRLQPKQQPRGPLGGGTMQPAPGPMKPGGPGQWGPMQPMKPGGPGQWGPMQPMKPGGPGQWGPMQPMPQGPPRGGTPPIYQGGGGQANPQMLQALMRLFQQMQGGGGQMMPQQQPMQQY